MRLRFVLSQAAKGVARNFAMTLSVILVTLVSLVFVGSGMLLQMQVAQMKSQWYNTIEVTVSMCVQSDVSGNCKGQKATEDQVKAIEDQLNREPLKSEVKEYHFEDEKAAYEEFKRQLGDTELGQSVTPDMLPVSFRIKLADPTHYGVIAQALSGQPGVQSVIDQRQLVQPLFNILNKSTAISLGFAGIMAVAAVLLIAMTIRISAMTREKETGIMRLVGASRFFIQLPFMLEGIFAALVGSILASITLWAGLHLLTDWLRPSFAWVSFIGNTQLAIVIPILIVASVVFAGLASLVSLNRYTKI